MCCYWLIALLVGTSVPFESLLGSVRVARVEGMRFEHDKVWSVNQDGMRFAQELLAALQCTPEDEPVVQVRDSCL